MASNDTRRPLRMERVSGGERRCEALEDDDDLPQLSASTLAALQGFLREQEAERAHENEEEEQVGGLNGADAGEYEMIKENWGMSQFWYDADTSKTVADELHHLTAGSGLPIACIACPSLYTQLKKSYPDAQVRLFEYDQRFRRYGADFVFNDYNQPVDIPSELRQSFHVVVADHPYVSQECPEKTIETMKYLAKDPETSPLILLTGGVQRDNAFKVFESTPVPFPAWPHQQAGQRVFAVYKLRSTREIRGLGCRRLRIVLLVSFPLPWLPPSVHQFFL